MQIRVPDYTPSERQTKFHTSTAFETLYGGAAGGGKSAAMCAEAVTLCLENPGIRVYIFRRTIPELKESIVPEIYSQCGEYIKNGWMVYNSQERQFTFYKIEKGRKVPTGSIIQLSYLDDPKDKFRYQSAEIHCLLIDELTHFKWEEYEYIRTRVRSDNPKMPLKVMAATNPGNIGHGWVKNYFINITSPESIYTDEARVEELVAEGVEERIARWMATRQFIPAKITDHPSKSFRSSYLSNLSSIQNPDLKRALKEGDWDVFQGQVFSEFRRSKLIDGVDTPWHVIKPFNIPGHWARWSAYDYGWKQAATLWFTQDPMTERIYVYREYYPKHITVKDQSSDMKRMESTDNIRFRLADPSMWKQTGDVNTSEVIADKFETEGLYFTEANNDRRTGLEMVHEALNPLPDGLPKMQIFTTCSNLIRTLPELPYDPHRDEDVDTDAEDHLYDALRYGLLSAKSAKRVAPKKPQAVLKRKQRTATWSR